MQVRLVYLFWLLHNKVIYKILASHCTVAQLYALLELVFHVTSAGETKFPHCSFDSNCDYNNTTILECGNELCNAQGYSGASFAEASNNFCTSSYTNAWTGSHAYLIDTHVIKYTYNNVAQIKAECILKGNNTFFANFYFQ